MLERIAVMDSAVIRSLLVAAVGLLGLLLSFFGVDEALFTEKAARVVDALLLLLTAGSVFYAAYARAAKPNPPLTEAAVTKTERMLVEGTLKEPPRQQGTAQPLFLAMLASAAIVAGCSMNSTRPTDVVATACKQSDQYLIERCAESIGEVYEIYQKRALELVSDPTTPGDLKEQLKSLDRDLTPSVRLLLQTSRQYVELKQMQSPAASEAEESLRAQLADVQPRVESLPPI